MKKLIAFAIAAVMVLSLIPAMAFSASAAEYAYPDPLSGPWSVYRGPASYKVLEEGAEPPTNTPAPGYKYTSEGFTTIPANYKNMSPWFTVQTSQPHDLKDGFYMQVRVDDYSYRGEDGAADAWIALTIADSRLASPGSTSHNNYFCSLIRGNGDGSATFESARGVKKTEDKAGSFGGDPTVVSGTVPMDEDGKEIYDIEIKWDGSNYQVIICGATVGNPTFVSQTIQDLEQCYVGLTFMSTVKDGTASCTILKMGTSKADAVTPDGNDEAEPEENTLVYGDPIDPSTIPAGQPCAVWDAHKTCFKSDPSAANMTFAATADFTYHLTAQADAVFFSWGIKNELTYMAEDFPVFVMMIKDYYGSESGTMYYNAGEILSANTNYMTSWSMYDDNSMFYGEDDEYCLVVADLTGLWEGRIHNVRIDWATGGSEDVPAEWDIEYMALFRNVEDAHAYAEEYMKNKGVNTETTEETNAPTEDENVGGDAQDTTENGGNEQGTTAGTADEKDTTVGGETSSTTEGGTKGEDKPADGKKGCSSVIGMGAVAILAAAAAAVVLKKKD